MKTDKPTGLKVTRDGASFTVTWKKGDTYNDGQQLEYKLYTAKSQDVANSGRNFLSQGFEINGTKWVPLTVSKTATKKVLTISESNYYPNTTVRIYGIAFRVRGNRGSFTKKGKTYNPGWSEWATKTVIIYPPNIPTIKSSWSGDYASRSTYQWSVSDQKWAPAKNILLQSVVKEDVAPGEIPGAVWNAATKSTKSLTGSTYYDETGLSGVSKTRGVRVIARGLGGYSAKWAYAYHVFAQPFKVASLEGTALYNKTTHVWDISASWVKSGTKTHPVDEYMLQYRIGKPGAGMTVTSDNDWVDTTTTKAGDMFAQFTDELSADECLWLRVTASHDNHTGAYAVASDPIRAYTGNVAAPTNLAITASDPSTREITVSVTNNSQITDSKIAIAVTGGPVVAVLSGSGAIVQSGIKVPAWTVGLYINAIAYVGTETYTTGDDGVKLYRYDPAMQSDVVYMASEPVKAPTITAAEKKGEDIRVDWNWPWKEANGAEVSWSTRKTAWNSNGAPESYKVTATGPASLYITGLETGKTYYIRVRLLKEESGETSYSDWSDIMMVYLSAAPVIPTLDLSALTINKGDELTASWTYTSGDGTPQAHAVIYEKIGAAYNEIAQTTTAQQVMFTPDWQENTQHELYLQVTSEAGMPSPLSNVQTVTVAPEPSCEITQASLEPVDDGYELQELPLTVTVTGAGEAGQVLLKIIRAADFVERRPSDEDFNGFEGQTVMQREYLGEGQQTIDLSDLIGPLDDTAQYRIVAQVTDGYGQTAKDAVDFTVNWTEQPVKPEATVEIHGTVAYINIIEPAGAHVTDTVDIYRLSVDGPELIYQDAAFGDTIVDPYPVVGEFGGYRIVLKTKNGDCYTAEQEPAWIDIDAGFESISQYIDFDGYQLPVTWNVDLDTSLSKNFKKTVYLGGNEAGDFLEGINRSGTIAGVQITERDTDDIRTLRALGQYQGLAHIRTKDGSSYWANVNTGDGLDHMSCRMYKTVNLQLEAVKERRLDGIPLAEWEVSS